MSPALRDHFADYAAFHATRGNQACHFVGIPIIVLTLFSLLAHLPIAHVGSFTVTAAEVLLAAVSVYYFTLDVPLAALMLVLSAGLLAAGRLLPLPVAVGLFVFGWILQFVGHYVYEKRSPAFATNLLHLFVGPLWIVAKATGRARADSLAPDAVR